MRPLILFAASMTLCVSACSSCRKPKPTDIDAAVPDSAVAIVDSGEGAVDASDATAVPAATDSAPVATDSTSTGTTHAAGGPFQGSFPGCLTGGFKASQTGSQVTGHSGDNYNQKLSHEVITFSCTAAGDVCKGTGTRVTKAKDGKTTPVGAPNRPVTLTHKPDGTMQFHMEGMPAPSVCKGS